MGAASRTGREHLQGSRSGGPPDLRGWPRHTRIIAGKVPKDTTPTTSTASLPVLARRFLADPHEIVVLQGSSPPDLHY